MSEYDHHSVPPGFEPPISTSPDGVAPAPYHTPTLPNSASAGIGKRRKNSKVKLSPTLKRASSTPQLGGLAVQENGALSPSAMDKRRNKLGYQRISIACSHCRRRKIRCVLAEADDLGRCNNCIRLKKECVFYPVDSAGGTESRAQSKTSLGSKSSSVISNSPSEMQPPGSKLDHDHEMGRFPQLASNAPPEFAQIDPVSGLGISASGTPVASEYSFDPRLGGRPGWNSAVFPSDMPGTEPPTPVNWGSSQMSDFASYPTTTAEHSPSMYPAYSFAQQRDEFVPQPPPLRSMSYGHIEPVIGHFPPPAPGPIEFARPGSASQYHLTPLDTVAPPACTMAEPSLTPVASEPTMTPMAMYPPQWGFYQQQQQSHPSMNVDYSSRHDSLNTQWYHPSQLGPAMTDHDPQHRQHPMSQPPGSGYAK